MELRVGDNVQNKVSGKVFVIDKVSPCKGWFRIIDDYGWSHVNYFNCLGRMTPSLLRMKERLRNVTSKDSKN